MNNPEHQISVERKFKTKLVSLNNHFVKKQIHLKIFLLVKVKIRVHENQLFSESETTNDPDSLTQRYYHQPSWNHIYNLIFFIIFIYQIPSGK